MTAELRFRATDRAGDVSCILSRPPGARCLFVFGHGAGAGMRHPFMQSVADKLARRGVATFRFQFPYMERGERRPDPGPILVKTVRSAVRAAAEASDGLPLFAGGKSMGGRMTSLAAADGGLPGVSGLVFFGFPLHAAGRPGTERAGHLPRVAIPMLFLQGTRDRLADLDLLRGVLADLGSLAHLCVIDGADHSFSVPKRSGRTLDETLDELADAVAGWAAALG